MREEEEEEEEEPGKPVGSESKDADAWYKAESMLLSLSKLLPLPMSLYCGGCAGKSKFVVVRKVLDPDPDCDPDRDPDRDPESSRS